MRQRCQGGSVGRPAASVAQFIPTTVQQYSSQSLGGSCGALEEFLVLDCHYLGPSVAIVGHL
eukprot:2453013-Karenia_brevis.AAC.1